MRHGCRRFLLMCQCQLNNREKESVIFLARCASMHSVRQKNFKKHMDQWIQGFRCCKTIPGEEKVLVPGDPEREMEAERMQNGIPLLDSVVKDLQDVGINLEFICNKNIEQLKSLPNDRSCN